MRPKPAKQIDRAHVGQLVEAGTVLFEGLFGTLESTTVSVTIVKLVFANSGDEYAVHHNGQHHKSFRTLAEAAQYVGA